VFISKLREGLPKCKVAHYIRRSSLYLMGENSHIDSIISKDYPLSYHYIQGLSTTSFYYTKNNLISYYIHSIEDNSHFKIVPLYNYVKNDYDIIPSNFDYSLTHLHDICLVKAPNRQIYMCAGNIIGNVSRGTLLYDLRNVSPLRFLSMPIANSFILVITCDIKEITIYVIDLIKERKYERRYPLEKVIANLLSLLEGNDRSYREIESLKYLDHLSCGYSSMSNIEKDTNGLVFYNRYMVKISLYFSSTTINVVKYLIDALNVIATFQNKKLTVSLQINDKLSIKTSYYNYEVDFGSGTVLMSNSYKMDDEYDISQSHLYSVIASVGDYTIISEPNVSRDMVALYYKDKVKSRFPIPDLDIDNLDNILFIRLSNKLIISASKNSLNEPSKTRRYYVRYGDTDIDVVDTQVVRELIKDATHKNNDKNLVALDVSDLNDIVIHVRLKDKLEKVLRSHGCPKDGFMDFYYMYYVDHDEEEFYALIYLKCSQILDDKRLEHKKPKIYLFRCKLAELTSDNTYFRLVRIFESDTGTYPNSVITSILYNKAISEDYGRILRFLSNKWNTGNDFNDLKIFEAYNDLSAYYDFEYNRTSIRTKTDTSIVSILHLVRRVEPLNFQS
jgi:hypothetical protein